MSSCEICNDLWQFLTQPDGEKKTIDLGSFDEALASPCPDHTRIIKAFRKHCDDDDIIPHSVRPDSSDVGFIRGGTGHSTALYQSIKKLGVVWNLIAARKEVFENHPGNGRVCDPDWLDLDYVLAWKRECLSSHGAKCQNPMRIPQVSPAWLVDVEKKCIVPGEDGRPYIALSYRSSRAAANMLRTAHVELQKDGALESSEILAQVPLKIRHAMSLAAAIGERYLWVDALCIDHSNRTATSEQLNLMTAIYAGAILTVVAADGDCTDAIAGLKETSEPRMLNQKVFPLGTEQVVVKQSDIFSLEHWHDYHKRGWTYQEFKMSPRKLLFMGGQAHWQCNCSVWHEELTLGSEVDTYIDPHPGVLSSGYPDLGSLGNMLSNYNRRELTYDEDALAAISGLLTVFSRSFTGGFLYGLPEMMFERALAWQPQWEHTNLRKRESSGQPSYVGYTATDLPTWSWVAWQGMFSFRYGEAARVNDRQHWFEEVTPITEWYTSSAPSGKPRRRIPSTWFEERDRRKDVNQPLPSGWSRLPAPVTGEFRNEPMLYPDGCGQYLYQHRGLPDDHCQTWYYPFEVPDIQSSTPYTIPEQTRYLFCRTWKVSVWSVRTHGRYSDEDEDNHVLTLRGSVDGPEIGGLHLQTDDQLSMWPKPASQDDTDAASNGELGKTIELAAINRCVHYAKTFNDELQRYDHPLERKERITVLWVAWKDGVAYRQACGHIDKGAWNSLAPATIDLVLG